MERVPIRVLIVEDDDDFAYLIRDQLTRQGDMEVVGRARDRRGALALAQSLEPQVVLMDLSLSAAQMDGVEAARDIRIATGAKVVILTVYEDPKVVLEASRRAFASGYVFKSQFALIPETVRATARGTTPQEWMILSLILDRLSPAERGVLDYILGRTPEPVSSPKTMANQKTSILRKLGLHSQRELLRVFRSLPALQE